MNTNFNRLSDEIEDVMNSEVPTQTIHILGKWRYVEPWLTKGIESAARKCRKLYKKTLDSSCNKEDISTYKQHWNLLNHLYRTTKKDYYNAECMEYRSNTKKLWSLINQTIKKCKSRGSIIPYISIDGLHIYQPKKIANRFGQFYSSIGENLAYRIKPGTKEVDYYLSQMQQSVNSLVLRETSMFEIEKLIRSLPNKVPMAMTGLATPC